MFQALIYDQDSAGWLTFSNAKEVLIARTVDEVRPLLDTVAESSAHGYFAVGFVSYEAASGFNPLLVHHPASDLPLAMFGIFEGAETPAPGSAPGSVNGAPLSLSPVLPLNEFHDAINRIKQYLRDGDSYQVNFTHRLLGECSARPDEIFSRLVNAQPSKYAALIETSDHAICSVSPELFFETDGKTIRTEPMKGTRPRGRHAQEDRQLREELIRSQKDRAENLMIVDMIRNDLGRIAEPGSVQVDELFQINKLPTVWQQVSRVSAKTTCSLGEIFAAMFPCASVTGAPKRRTMELIHELEAGARGVYTGAIGLVKPNQNSRFSVAIRTLTLDKKTQRASYGVGGGIVWDSDPAEEWSESLVKGEVLNYEAAEFQLLETMRVEPDSGIFLFSRHLQRLRASAEYFDYDFNEGAIVEAIHHSINKTMQATQSNQAMRLRLLLSADGSVELECHKLAQTPDVMRLRLASEPVQSRDIFLFHKTTHRSVYETAIRDAEGCDDVILWNERGELTETTISNLYLELDGELLTPALDSGLLAGTYRQMMLEEGRVREATLSKSDLNRADQLYVSNSVRNLVPAVLI